MKRFILILTLAIFTFSYADAQRRKAFVPKDDPDEYDEEVVEETRKEVEIMQNPDVSDQAQRRMIKHRERRRENEYDRHHKEIQDKKTLKKMKKDKKKSEAYNQHKRPLKSRIAARKKARRR